MILEPSTEKGRVYKLSCEECGAIFYTREKLKRHKDCKQNLANIDDKESPTKDMSIEAVGNDETCLVISRNTTKEVLLYLHCDECWNRSRHSCPNLPVMDTLTEASLHLPNCSVVLGDLAMAGCYMDWSNVESILLKMKSG